MPSEPLMESLKMPSEPLSGLKRPSEIALIESLNSGVVEP
jgi:hypothetical protein